MCECPPPPQKKKERERTHEEKMNNAELKVNQIEMAISREQTLANKNRRRNFASVLNSNARDIPFLLWK